MRDGEIIPGDTPSQYWHAVDGGFVESAIEVQAQPPMLLALHDLLTRAGYTVRVVDAIEYEDICERIEYA